MKISLNNIRQGHFYELKNYSEITCFEVLSILSEADCEIKDLYTLEKFLLSDLIRYGVSDDYELNEITLKK